MIDVNYAAGELVAVRGERAAALIDDRGASSDASFGLIASVSSGNVAVISLAASDALDALMGFGVVVETDTSHELTLAGEVYAVMSGETGWTTIMAHPGVVHRLELPLSASVHLGSRATESTAAREVETLVGGAVRAVSLDVIAPGGEVSDYTGLNAAPDALADMVPPTGPATASDVATGLPATQQMNLVDLEQARAARAPLPVELAPEDAGKDQGDDEHDDHQVLGIRCPADHHNHPNALYCSQCGRRMGVNQTAVAVVGPRPPLGILLIDDVATHTIVTDFVIGRDPETAAESLMRRGVLKLEDDANEISRAHVDVVLDGWNVTVRDLDSANGTGLCRAGSDTWEALPGTATVLGAGDVLRVGQRELQLELHHVQT